MGMSKSQWVEGLHFFFLGVGGTLARGVRPMPPLFNGQPLRSVGAYLHYRTVDVSTVRELLKRLRPQLLLGLKTKHLRRGSFADDPNNKLEANHI
jgi:hypothetical protein